MCYDGEHFFFMILIYYTVVWEREHLAFFKVSRRTMKKLTVPSAIYN